MKMKTIMKRCTLGTTVILVFAFMAFWFFYPRVKYDYSELKTVKICYYDYEYHQIVIEDEAEKNELYNLIKKSWLTSLNLFYTGDDNGTDGIEIHLLYSNGDTEYFSVKERDDVFTKYIYSKDSQIPLGRIQIKNNKLENAINGYITRELTHIVRSSEYRDNLIYYGDTAIRIDMGSTIIIRLKGLDDYDSFKSVFVSNCNTKQVVQLPVLKEIIYTVEEDGYYNIYAITDEGRFVNLSNSIGIEKSYATDSRITMY